MTLPRAALILAGGGGTRLWPLSRPDRPKPFIPNFPRPGPSLIAQTVERLEGVIPPEHIYIVSSAQHVEALHQALGGWDSGQLIIEPAARNTAAAIAYGLAWVQEHRGLDAVWAILPADHCVRQRDQFRTSLEEALQLASHDPQLVTMGIQPTYPSTQFGYIRVAEQGKKHLRGLSFTEKPDRQRAKAWLDAGDYVWNAGIFLGRAQSVRQAMQEHCPNIWSGAEASVREPAQAKAQFEALQSTPFDRAVMEKLSSFSVLPLDAGWNDVGQWARAGQELTRDDQGNASVDAAAAHTQMIDAQGCSVWNQDAQVTIIGARDLSVVVDQGRILVVAAGHEDKVSEATAVAQVKSEDEHARE